MQDGSKTPLIIGVVVVALVALGAVLWVGMSNDDDNANQTTQSQQADQEETAEAPTQNIVEIAAADENFSTLVSAVQAAGLGETLADESKEYTVFAPTNDAFAKLPAGTLDSLLLPENKDTLTGILTYHVVEGAVASDKLSNGQKIKTVNGAELTVQIENGSVYVVDAKGGRAMVTKPDIKATNGVIHVIDSVVLPS